MAAELALVCRVARPRLLSCAGLQFEQPDCRRRRRVGLKPTSADSH